MAQGQEERVIKEEIHEFEGHIPGNCNQTRGAEVWQ